MVTAVGLLEQDLGPSHAKVANALSNLGNVHISLRDVASARECFERALAIKEASFGAEHAETAITLQNLCNVAWGTGTYAVSYYA